jgi:hypothetical protein
MNYFHYRRRVDKLVAAILVIAAGITFMAVTISLLIHGHGLPTKSGGENSIAQTRLILGLFAVLFVVILRVAGMDWVEGVRLNDNEIVYRNWLGKSMKIPYQDVTTLENRSEVLFVVRSTRGSFRFFQSIQNHKDLISELERRTGRTFA